MHFIKDHYLKFYSKKTIFMAFLGYFIPSPNYEKGIAYNKVHPVCELGSTTLAKINLIHSVSAFPKLILHPTPLEYTKHYWTRNKNNLI